MTEAQSQRAAQIKTINDPAKAVHEFEKDNGEIVLTFGASDIQDIDQRLVSYIVMGDGAVTYVENYDLVLI